jgi:hypothetical protein
MNWRGMPSNSSRTSGTLNIRLVILFEDVLSVEILLPNIFSIVVFHVRGSPFDTGHWKESLQCVLLSQSLSFLIFGSFFVSRSRNSSVSIVTGYRLDDREVGVWVLVG